MNVKTISQVLIWGGACFLLYGMFMSTSVDTIYGPIHNQSLAARQISLLIFGGVQLIAGVILFGLRKMKQTPQEEATEDQAEKEKRQVQIQAMKETMSELRRKLEKAVEKLKKTVAPINSKVQSLPMDRYWLRIATGLLTGLWMATIALYFSPSLAILVFIACGVYALYSRDERRSRMRLIWTAVVVTLLVVIAFVIAIFVY